jgi:hypothetical protein
MKTVLGMPLVAALSRRSEPDTVIGRKTVASFLPASLPEYLSKLALACDSSPGIENAEGQKLAARFNRLQDLDIELEVDKAEIEQIAETMRQIIAAHPRTWMAFEASRMLSQIQPAVRP